jgi:hypothetical protein
MRDLRAGPSQEQYLSQKERMIEYQQALAQQVKEKGERKKKQTQQRREQERREEEEYNREMQIKNKRPSTPDRGLNGNKGPSFQDQRPRPVNVNVEAPQKSPGSPLSPKEQKFAAAAIDHVIPIAKDGLFGDPNQAERKNAARQQWQADILKQMDEKKQKADAAKRKAQEDERIAEERVERQRQEILAAYQKETGVKQKEKTAPQTQPPPESGNPNQVNPPATGGRRRQAAARNEIENDNKQGPQRPLISGAPWDPAELDLKDLRKGMGSGLSNNNSGPGVGSRTKIFGSEIEDLQNQIRRDQLDLKNRLSEQDDLINVLKRDAQEDNRFNRANRGRDMLVSGNRGNGGGGGLNPYFSQTSSQGSRIRPDATLPHASRMLPIEDSLTMLEQTVGAGISSQMFGELNSARSNGGLAQGTSNFMFGGGDANFDELFDDRKPAQRKRAPLNNEATLDLDALGKDNDEQFNRLQHLDERDALGLSGGFEHQVSSLLPVVESDRALGGFRDTGKNDELLRRFAMQSTM